MPYTAPLNPLGLEFYTLGTYVPPVTDNMLIEFSDFASYTRVFKSKDGGILQTLNAFVLPVLNCNEPVTLINSFAPLMSVASGSEISGSIKDSLVALMSVNSFNVESGNNIFHGFTDTQARTNIPSCYWFNSWTEFQALHGSDITSDWTGKTFRLNDVIFIYDDDNDLQIYYLTKFSSTVISEPPYIITGPIVTGLGYTIWYRVNVAYSSTVIEIVAASNISCASSFNATVACNFLDTLVSDLSPCLFTTSYNWQDPDHTYSTNYDSNGINDRRIFLGTFSFEAGNNYLVFFDTLI